jgi:hypothetical protein
MKPSLAIFLDIDGVLNSSRLFKRLRNTESTKEEIGFVTEIANKYYPGFPLDALVNDLRSIDPICVGHLNQIIGATEAQVVVSSSWRFSHPIIGLQKLLEYRGFKGLAHDITPVNLGNDIRGYEIQAWLDLHSGVDRFVILDDNKDMLHLRSHLVLTDKSVGLTRKDAKKAISVLVPIGTGGA